MQRPVVAAPALPAQRLRCGQRPVRLWWPRPGQRRTHHRCRPLRRRHRHLGHTAGPLPQRARQRQLVRRGRHGNLRHGRLRGRLQRRQRRHLQVRHRAGGHARRGVAAPAWQHEHATRRLQLCGPRRPRLRLRRLLHGQLLRAAGVGGGVRPGCGRLGGGFAHGGGRGREGRRRGGGGAPGAGGRREEARHGRLQRPGPHARPRRGRLRPRAPGACACSGWCAAPSAADS